MKMPRFLIYAATSLTFIGVTGLSLAPAASAGDQPVGQTSLAEVLTSDGNKFDKNLYDFDMVTETVLYVLSKKPSSSVGLLADGSVPLTAFIPNDRAFQLLVADLTGTTFRCEWNLLAAIKTLPVDTLEAVLLYHVVPGPAIDSSAALQADGVALQTALEGASFTVDVINPAVPAVRLIDADTDDVNPWLLPRKLDINSGNLQIAHGISQVLRPIDL